MIRFVRSISVLIAFLIFGIGSLILSFIIFPTSHLLIKKEKQKHFLTNLIHKIWKFFVKGLELSNIIKVEIDNKEILDNVSGKIIVASHPSYIDIVLLISLIKNSVCIAKKEIKNNIIMKNIVNSIYIVNDENHENLIKDAQELLDQGFNIIIFPTGTRISKDAQLKVQKGAALLSLHTRTNILPITIKTDYPFLQKGQKIYDANDKPIKYTLSIHEEISPEYFLNQYESDIKQKRELTKKIKEKII